MRPFTLAPATEVRHALLVFAGIACLAMWSCGSSGTSRKPGGEIDRPAADMPATASETAGMDPKDLPPPTTKPGAMLVPLHSDPALLAPLDAYYFQCGGKLIDLKEPLREIVARLTADSLWYPGSRRYRGLPLSDCSGIFHRVLRGMRERCDEYEVPDLSHRDTRSLARWYHQRGDLILIEDALQQADLLKEGAVVFFGRRGVSYTAANLHPDTLFSRRRGIEHMGVVVKVERDAGGKVINYHLFHGQRPGKMASTTTFHARKPSRRSYKPFGTGRQQWVAVARLLNPSARLAKGE